MNQLPLKTRVDILSMLCEGTSMRSISRIADVSINTVTKLLVSAGKACSAFHDANLRKVRAKRVQVDAIWSFTYAKQKNVSKAKKAPPNAGDTWTWTAVEADTRLIISWLVGGRDGQYAAAFMRDLRSRLLNRVQLTSGGHQVYVDAIEAAFGADIDYGRLVKLLGVAPELASGHRSPAGRMSIRKERIEGNPDPKHVSTSYAERQNLTMRMHMRRFTRQTNAFSKKLENHSHMVALYAVWYNFVKIHSALRMTPAMAAGISDRLWSMEDLAEIIDEALPKGGQRGASKKIQTETLLGSAWRT